MKDIHIYIKKDHSVDFEDDYAGLNKENLQGNIIFDFAEFVPGTARVEIIIDNTKGYIELEQVEFDTGTKFKNICSCDEKLFSDDELRVLDLVKNKLKKYSASSLSDWSHKFKGWKDTKDGEVINH